MTASILDEFQHKIAEWTVVPSKGGVFEVTVDGELIFSKKQLNRHADEGEVRQLIEARICAAEQGD